MLKIEEKKKKTNEESKLIKGHLEVHKAGFAFLLPEEEGYADVYIAKTELNNALHNDHVLVRLLPSSKGKRLEGEVVEIVKRANETIVGIVQKNKRFGFVVPDDSSLTYDVYIPAGKLKGAKNDEKVVVKIYKWPENGMNMEGEVVEILGHKNDPGVDILSIIRQHNLPEDFPQEVWREVKTIPQTISEKEIAKRVDLREQLLITIDGEDAKDLDDAVSISRKENGNYLLGVHIADVGYYVKEGSYLDEEAYKRGTSVYLVDRVIPMLPPELSNGICSLNANEDRLAMSAFMEFDSKGNLVSSDIQDTVIRVQERMTYTNVRKILEDKEPAVCQRYNHLLNDLQLMEKLADILRKNRFANGSIDFDFPEIKVILDEQGKPIDLQKRPRTVAEQLIEEFMLAANRTVAETMFWLQVPFLYRVHENPSEEKVIFLQQFLHNLGYNPKNLDKGHPAAFQAVLDKVSGKPEERVVNTIVLRCMQRARYDHESLGHFGLAAKYYSHFTSPIRRYPDLIIHRIMREVRSKGRLDEKRYAHLAAVMPQIAGNTSTRERIAEEAERDSVDLKKVEYMQSKVGEVFSGIISSIQPFGIFVELENLIEGLIHVSNLDDDYYNYYPENYTMIGERTGKTYKIGDKIEVKVIGANLEERKIDLLIAAPKKR